MYETAHESHCKSSPSVAGKYIASPAFLFRHLKAKLLTFVRLDTFQLQICYGQMPTTMGFRPLGPSTTEMDRLTVIL